MDQLAAIGGILSQRSSANEQMNLISSQPTEMHQHSFLGKELEKLSDEQIDRLLEKVNRVIRKEQASLQQLRQAPTTGTAPSGLRK